MPALPEMKQTTSFTKKRAPFILDITLTDERGARPLCRSREMPLRLNGMRIIESAYLTEPGEPIEVRRTWRERLLTWPWNPFRATKTVVPQVPMPGGYQLSDGSMVMHPAIVAKLKTAVRADARPVLGTPQEP